MADEQKDTKWQTESGIPLKNVYRPEDLAGLDYDRDLGDPGKPPFTRGPYPEMYRSRLWRISQLTGSGSVGETSKLLQFFNEVGGDWVNLDRDQLTSNHLWDPDHPEVLARKDDVGATGVPILSLADLEEVLKDVALEKRYIHMVGTPWMNSLYFSLAEKRGIPLTDLHGTGQGEMTLTYVSTPFKDFPHPRCTLRNNGDLIEFHTKYVPHVVPVSVAGHNVRADGVTAYQELAVVLANNIEYIEEVLRRGKLGIDEFAANLGGINYSIGRDFFEEICKCRAGRRMWYKLLTERYHSKDPRSWRLRIHGFSADRDYTYQQPLVNIVRSAYRTVAAALAGCQSLGIGPYDEAITNPTEEALLMAVRTHQVIQLESGITNVADPLAGSYYVEWLTNELEQKAWEYLAKIEAVGGYLKAIETGWLHQECIKAALEQEKKLATGEKKLVGANCFQMAEEPFQVPARRPARAWDEAMAKVEKLRRERDNSRVTKALDGLKRAIESDENQIPAMMEVAKSGATVGEVGKVYRDIWGIWNAPIKF
ncbi:MAG: methylmalonyl-CoA mutase family protein [Dehalococcoidia bacterium]|nr:methylmalonyl-CoA mutase family protein [Dehalococcoidia bacterium]